MKKRLLINYHKPRNPLVKLRAITIPNKKKQANKNICRQSIKETDKT